MPAPYRRGRLKKRNLISSIKKRFTGGRAAAKQKTMLFCIFLQHASKTLCTFIFSKGNLVVGTRSLSSGLDPNEKSQGYLSNTNGDSRHTSKILDSSQPSKHSKWIHLSLDTNQLTFEANIWTSRNDYIFYFFGGAHKHRSLVSWSWLVLRSRCTLLHKINCGKMFECLHLKEQHIPGLDRVRSVSEHRPENLNHPSKSINDICFPHVSSPTSYNQINFN